MNKAENTWNRTVARFLNDQATIEEVHAADPSRPVTREAVEQPLPGGPQPCASEGSPTTRWVDDTRIDCGGKRSTKRYAAIVMNRMRRARHHAMEAYPLRRRLPKDGTSITIQKEALPSETPDAAR